MWQAKGTYFYNCKIGIYGDIVRFRIWYGLQTKKTDKVKGLLKNRNSVQGRILLYSISGLFYIFQHAYMSWRSSVRNIFKHV